MKIRYQINKNQLKIIEVNKNFKSTIRLQVLYHNGFFYQINLKSNNLFRSTFIKIKYSEVLMAEKRNFLNSQR